LKRQGTRIAKGEAKSHWILSDAGSYRELNHDCVVPAQRETKPSKASVRTSKPFQMSEESRAIYKFSLLFIWIRSLFKWHKIDQIVIQYL